MRTLADQITDWAHAWEDAARLGLADASLGMEWRHSLDRWLAMSETQRLAWLARPRDWQVQYVHHHGTGERAVNPSTAKREAARAVIAAVVERWIAERIETTGGDESDRLTMTELMTDFGFYTSTLGIEVPSGRAGLTRAVTVDCMVASGGKWDAHGRRFIGARFR
jgi:hypothetical protein